MVKTSHESCVYRAERHLRLVQMARERERQEALRLRDEWQGRERPATAGETWFVIGVLLVCAVVFGALVWATWRWQ